MIADERRLGRHRHSAAAAAAAVTGDTGGQSALLLLPSLVRGIEGQESGKMACMASQPHLFWWKVVHCAGKVHCSGWLSHHCPPKSAKAAVSKDTKSFSWTPVSQFTQQSKASGCSQQHLERQTPPQGEGGEWVGMFLFSKIGVVPHFSSEQEISSKLYISFEPYQNLWATP